MNDKNLVKKIKNYYKNSLLNFFNHFQHKISSNIDDKIIELFENSWKFDCYHFNITFKKLYYKWKINSRKGTKKLNVSNVLNFWKIP